MIISAAGINVEVIDHPHENVYEDFWDPTVTLHTAVISDGETAIGSVGVMVRPRDSVDIWTAIHMDDVDAGWLVEFDRVEINRDHLGRRFGLRLVADAMTHLTRGRNCLVTLVAEPRNWESLRQRDRGPALVALDRHWAQLGFDGGEVRPDSVRPRLMRIAARNYQPPTFHVIPIGW